jgi:hypothetical protein
MRKLWLDFETRSTVDLKDSGLDRYTKDPTTEVLMLGWAYDDDEVSLWQPHSDGPLPAVLRAGLSDPDVLKMAWNYNFEKAILKHKLGIDIPQDQWFDPSVLCAYLSLPIGLDRAANACNIDIDLKKTVITGKNKPTKVFSEPSKRKKTELKKNPSLSPTYFKDWSTDPEKWDEFCEYCRQDVRAERAVWYGACDFKCPMPGSEIQAWLLDQRMNERGVYIDMDYVTNALKYAVTESDGLVAEIKELSGVENPNSGPQMKTWFATQNYPFSSLDKAHVDEALKEAKRFKITPDGIKVLELKKKLGGSAYKKLQSILDRVSTDQRLRNQFMYHGAHTGRWSGRGVQLQNLFKAIKNVSMVLDPVTQGIRTGTLDIPKIVTEFNAKVDEWNAANSDKKPKDKVKPFSMMDAVAGTIRSAFCATPGKKMTVGDLAQIESRVLAGLAQCQTMINAYASGLDLYKDIMSFLLEKPYAEIDSKERANGKVIILGCFEENTLVLTNSGWKRIVDVGTNDLVFDGLNFVTHGGVIAQGKKEVIPVCGVGVTPDHRFLSKGWVQACRLQKNIQLEKRASSLGIGSFLSIDSTRFPLDTCVVVKGVTKGSSLTKLTWKKGELGHVYPVLTDGFGKNKTEYTFAGPISPEKLLTDLQTDTTLSSPALDRPFEGMAGSDMQGAASKIASIVSTTSSATSRLSTDMNLLAWRLTESTMTDTTNEETSDSLLDEKTSKIEVDTFDILNAGPNSRFMILTTSGPMIVHNCGFGMGWEKFIEYAATFGVTLDEATAKRYVKAFREKYHEIPAFWKALDAACVKAVKLNICIYVNGMVVDGRNPSMLKIKLPSGRYLHYLRPTIKMEETSWGEIREGVSYEGWDEKGAQDKRLYGGLICENVVQAVARDILLNGMMEAEKMGFLLIMTIHDEAVGESDEGGALGEKQLLAALTMTPEWAEGLGFVLAAEGYECTFYKK